MSEYTEGVRCQQAVDQDRASIHDQITEFFSKGGEIKECTPSDKEVKEELAKKYRPMLAKKSHFKGIGLGEK